MSTERCPVVPIMDGRSSPPSESPSQGSPRAMRALARSNRWEAAAHTSSLIHTTTPLAGSSALLTPPPTVRTYAGRRTIRRQQSSTQESPIARLRYCAADGPLRRSGPTKTGSGTSPTRGFNHILQDLEKTIGGVASHVVMAAFTKAKHDLMAASDVNEKRLELMASALKAATRCPICLGCMRRPFMQVSLKDKYGHSWLLTSSSSPQSSKMRPHVLRVMPARFLLRRAGDQIERGSGSGEHRKLDGPQFCRAFGKYH
ncbi:hypothetical protein Hypma_003317 [Hypsizygus marmoreus]|uniref:Uncharacterized protein n=1 Tax=Hypsizygus marmoreus TaxID=39966 RepID=A0A369J4T8_HYPMA|nr:hypothetical protein Hypma_003317 [Hypsizygus marmoreus]